MKKRLLTILAGLMAVSAVSYSFGGALTHEFKHKENRTSDSEQIEWTLAKGNLKFGDRLRFDFDVDKDIFLKDGSKNLDGWDTAFGMNVKGFTFDAFGYTWQNENYFGFEWDAKETRDGNGDGKNDQSADMKTTKERYYISPRINTQVTDWTWFQIDPRFVKENTNSDYYGDIRLQFGTDWGNGWENWLEVYNIVGRDEDSDYVLDVENYLSYTKQIWGPIYSWTEFGLEAYGMSNSQKGSETADPTEVSVYADPQLQIRTEIAGIKVKTYVGYTMYEGDVNYQQIESGIAFSARF